MHTSGLDEDGDGEISKDEFLKLLEVKDACLVLTEIGVDVFNLVDNADFIFDQNMDDDGNVTPLTFPDFMEVVLKMRGSNGATVKDIVELRKAMTTDVKGVANEMEKMLKKHMPSLSLDRGHSPNRHARCGESNIMHSKSESESPSLRSNGDPKNGDPTPPAHMILDVASVPRPRPHSATYQDSRSPPIVKPSMLHSANTPGEILSPLSPKSFKRPLDQRLEFGEAELSKLIDSVAESISKQLASSAVVRDAMQHVPGQPIDLPSKPSKHRAPCTEAPNPDTIGLPDWITTRTDIEITTRMRSDGNMSQSQRATRSDGLPPPPTDEDTDSARGNAGSQKLVDLHRQLIRLKTAMDTGLPPVQGSFSGEPSKQFYAKSVS